MIKIRIISSIIVFSLVLISCRHDKDSSTDNNTYEPFFTDKRAQAIEAARSLGVSDASLDGLWLAFFIDEDAYSDEMEVDDVRYVFKVLESDSEVTFQICAGATNGTATTVAKDINGNIQIPEDFNLLRYGPAIAPIDLSLTSNTYLDFGSWTSIHDTKQSLIAVKIRDDASLPVGTLLDEGESVDLYCLNHINSAETSDNFKTQSRNILISAIEGNFNVQCNSYLEEDEYKDENENEIVGYVSGPVTDNKFFYKSLGATVDLIIADYTLTYTCEMDDGISGAAIIYDLK